MDRQMHDSSIEDGLNTDRPQAQTHRAHQVTSSGEGAVGEVQVAKHHGGRSEAAAEARRVQRQPWAERVRWGGQGSTARWRRPGGEAARRLDCSMAQFSVNHEVRLEAPTFVYQSNSARQSYGSPFLLKTLFHFIYFGTNMIPLLHKYLWK